MENKLTTIYIVRHGETEWNRQKLLQGHSDSPLTPTGIQQAKQIAQELKRVHFDEVFTSDLLRAKRTAEIIALEKQLAVKTTIVLREQNFGAFEGKPFTHYNQTLRKLIEKYQITSSRQLAKLKVSPTAESQDQALSRFITFLREIAVGFSSKTVLIVTHGSLMRHFLIHLGFGDHTSLPPGSIANTAYIKLASDGVDFFVKETKGITKKE